MSRLLIDQIFKITCVNCKHEFNKLFTEDDFLKDENYEDTLEYKGINNDHPKRKEELDNYLSLEEYYLECPSCKNIEQVGTSIPQWFLMKKLQKH
jgi:hypothetical protein